MSNPEEPVISEVAVKWNGDHVKEGWTEVILSLKGNNILALTNPLDPEEFTLLPLDSGLVEYVTVKRSEGIEE